MTTTEHIENILANIQTFSEPQLAALELITRSMQPLVPDTLTHIESIPLARALFTKLSAATRS